MLKAVKTSLVATVKSSLKNDLRLKDLPIDSQV